MNKKLPLIIGIVLLGIIILWFVGSYNNLVSLDESVKQKWSQVENVYQRRLDLIPNLVETVKGYVKHEEGVLTRVTELRSQVGQMRPSPEMLDNPEAMKRFTEAQSQLGGALSRLLVVSEQYPDLKANQTFVALQAQLEGSENRIAVERKRFIESVQEFNSAIKRFPGNIVAGMGGFKEKAYYTADEGAEKAPKVKF